MSDWSSPWRGSGVSVASAHVTPVVGPRTKRAGMVRVWAGRYLVAASCRDCSQLAIVEKLVPAPMQPGGRTTQCKMCCSASAVHRKVKRNHGERKPSFGHPLRHALKQSPEAALSLISAKAERSAIGCWLWPGSRNGQGYGQVAIPELATVFAKKQFVQAHRAVFYLASGQVPPASMPIHHKCAVRACVNPDHLQLVTHHENTAEMLERNAYIRRIADLETEVRALRAQLAQRSDV